MYPLPLSAPGTVGAGLQGLEVPSSIIKSPPLRSAPSCVMFSYRSQPPARAIFADTSRSPAPSPRPVTRRRSPPRADGSAGAIMGGKNKQRTKGNLRVSAATWRHRGRAPASGVPSGRAGPPGGLRPPWGSRSVVGERGASSVLGLPPRLKWVKKEKKKRERSQLGTWLTCLEEVGTCGELWQGGVN